jgi:hypothetical protein
MLRYNFQDLYSFERVPVMSVAEHLKETRADFPTRRKRINQFKRDIEDIQWRVDHISKQLNEKPMFEGQQWAFYHGDKYNANDVHRYEVDLKNMRDALKIVELETCPTKTAAPEPTPTPTPTPAPEPTPAQRPALNILQSTPQEITLTLPAGFDAHDLRAMISNQIDQTRQDLKKAHRIGFVLSEQLEQIKLDGLENLASQTQYIFSNYK